MSKDLIKEILNQLADDEVDFHKKSRNTDNPKFKEYWRGISVGLSRARHIIETTVSQYR